MSKCLYRVAVVLEKGSPELVSSALLEAIAETPKPSESASGPATGNTLDLGKWLQRKGIASSKERSWNGGMAFELAVCPFNPQHRHSAHAEQRGNGAISAGCHHKHCVWGWTDLYEKFSQASAAGTVPPRKSEPAPSPRVPSKPELNSAALHGVAGIVVNTILQHSEADTAALLLHFLAAFGNIIGRSAFFPVESTRHYCNCFFVLVGETSKGRKGTAWNRVRDIFRRMDPDWRVQSGLSSGEGLIAAVRGEDETSTERRLFIVQPEFASTLQVMGRSGSILSPIIREAWESGTLQTLVVHNPQHVEGAHISIVGHITCDEFRRSLPATEIANGLVNRFLLVRSARSKLLPEGGVLEEGKFLELVDLVLPAVLLGSKAGRMRRDDKAKALWASVYEELSTGKPGMFGAVTSRAEAQVLRLSMIYALLDQTVVIQVPHLAAAIAVWRYCEETARWIFGDALGDPTADDILAVLLDSPQGLTRTQLRDHFSRNRSAADIRRALELLREHGKVRMEMRQTAGRSAEVWMAISPPGSTTETM